MIDFEKSSNREVHKNPSSGSQVVPCGQTDMKKVTVTSHNFVNMPKHMRKWQWLH